MIVILDEGERMSLLRTIEGDSDPSALEYVSTLKPKFADPRTVDCFEHAPEAVALGLLDTCEVLQADQNALKLRLQIAAECIQWQARRIALYQSLTETPDVPKDGG